MKSTSASLRLTCWFSLIFLCGFVLFGIAMWIDLAYSLSQGRDRTLARRAARFAELLEETAGETPAHREARFEQLADIIPEGNLIQVFTRTGQRVLPGRPSPPDFPWPSLSNGARAGYSTIQAGARTFRLLEFPVGAGPLVLLVAGQLEDNRNMMARFTAGLAGAIPVMLALSAVAGYFLGKRVLLPVDQIAATLHSINIGNLSRRLPASPSGDEFDRLAETCNQMLARLEGAVDRINRFTADASHELRSPVALIRGVAEYALRNPKMDEESKDAFHEILAESVEATLLLEDMLTLARADAGHSEAVFEPVELSEVVEEVCAKLRPLADAKGQSVTVRAAGPVWTSGDRSAIRRLLSILLDNAIKYTPYQGSIEVELTLAAQRAVVTVSDNGIGISEELLPRIFDRFARADPSRGEVNGAGLGLAIAKWIADIHGAVLSVQSREQQGSAFAVEFQLAEPGAPRS